MFFQLLLVVSLVYPVFLAPVADPTTQNDQITENESPTDDLLNNNETPEGKSPGQEGEVMVQQETFYPVGVMWGVRPWGGWGGYRPWYGWHGYHKPHWGGPWGGGHWGGGHWGGGHWGGHWGNGGTWGRASKK